MSGSLNVIFHFKSQTKIPPASIESYMLMIIGLPRLTHSHYRPLKQKILTSGNPITSKISSPLLPMMGHKLIQQAARFSRRHKIKILPSTLKLFNNINLIELKRNHKGSVIMKSTCLLPATILFPTPLQQPRWYILSLTLLHIKILLMNTKIS